MENPLLSLLWMAGTPSRLPSPREAAGRGRGWGAVAERKDPPPLTPPRHSLREWVEGNGESLRHLTPHHRDSFAPRMVSRAARTALMMFW